MAEHDPNDELSVEELEQVAGGLADNSNCGGGCVTNEKLCSSGESGDSPSVPSGA